MRYFRHLAKKYKISDVVYSEFESYLKKERRKGSLKYGTKTAIFRPRLATGKSFQKKTHEIRISKKNKIYLFLNLRAKTNVLAASKPSPGLKDEIKKSYQKRNCDLNLDSLNMIKELSVPEKAYLAGKGMSKTPKPRSEGFFLSSQDRKGSFHASDGYRKGFRPTDSTMHTLPSKGKEGSFDRKESGISAFKVSNRKRKRFSVSDEVGGVPVQKFSDRQASCTDINDKSYSPSKEDFDELQPHNKRTSSKKTQKTNF